METARQHRRQDHPLFEQLEPRLLLDALGEPYLQAVDANSVYVLLEADTAGDATVEYGLTASYGDAATTISTEVTQGNNRVHNIQLTGLLANTQYHYRVTHGGTTSADYRFWTAAEAGTDFRFAWMADPRTQTAIHDTIAGLVDGFDPRFSLYGGDLCASATRSSWNSEFFVPNEQALIAQAPFFNAAGNHEGWNALTRAFTQGPDAAGEANGYYSLDYGDLHVLVLNTEIDYSPGSDQWNFAASDLAASTSTWNIVTAHKPAYSSYRETAGMKDMATSIFEPNGVDMVLAGHDHFYEHNVINGIHHMVIGSAGAPLYTPSGAAPYTIYSESTYNFAIFDVTAGSLQMVAYDELGEVIETINLFKDDTPPTAPTGLTANAVSDSQIGLSWTAASDPESGIGSYNIYRDSILIGSTAAVSYSDTGLNEATAYSYEVSAVNGDLVEGPTSGPVVEQTDADTTAPTIVSASAPLQSEVAVVFSEPVDQISAEITANYSIDLGVTVSSVTLQGDGVTVLLTVATLQPNVTYTLTVNNIVDLAAVTNTIAPDTQVAFQYVTQTDLTFQQGAGGYVGTRDTMIRGADSAQNFAAVIEVNADSDSGGQPSHALFRFDNIIGVGLDQIAPNSTILSATLRIHSNDDGNGGSLHPMLIAWDDTVVTWTDSFGGDGIQADDSEAASIADDNAASNSPNTDVDFDVTATLQAWTDGGTNEGWAILPNGTNGFRMATAEHSTMDYRPELLVTFLPAIADPTPPSAATDLAAVGASPSQVDLTWTAADDPDSGIDHYNIYRDNILVDSTAATSYSDTGLTASTAYMYEVSAVNGGMVEGPRSGQAVGTTLADTVAPTAKLTLDGIAQDLQPAVDQVTITSDQGAFEIQLADDGSSIDDSTVIAGGLTFDKDATGLILDVDYTFSYDSLADRITLAPLGGDFSAGQYDITLSGVTDIPGNAMAPAALSIEIGVATLRNVIVLIGDGMGFEQINAAHMYLGGDLVFEAFPYQGEITTYSANAAIPDSAAATTAIATGQKVDNDVVSVAIPGDGTDLPTALEIHKDLGKATGLVTTTQITHATTASFGAHADNRGYTTEIANDLLTQSRPNIMFSGGGSLDAGGDPQYTVVTDASELQGLDTNTETHVSGQFGTGQFPYEYDGLGDLPHLSEMSTTALDILDNDPDGFFLMIEGGLIDKAAHVNDIARTVDEVVEFANSVQVVFDWAAGRTDTLLIVTADHETGGLVVSDNGAGNMPGATWASAGHTAANVPVYAWGTNADVIAGVMDNIDLFPLISGAEAITAVAQGATWKYLDDGSDQGAAWRESAFDDSAWADGPAQLGYGDGDEATVVSFGPNASNKYTTTYLRHSFEITDSYQYTELTLNLLVDDGAVVYLNGQEVVRKNMPAGSIDSSTFATVTVGGADESTFTAFAIDTEVLTEGTNVLAVEVHQCNLTSSDLSFDLELEGTRLSGPDTAAPVANLAAPQDNGPGDLDPTIGAVTVGFGQEAFWIQLSDTGSGVEDSTVTAGTVTLSLDSVMLTEGLDYVFFYDSASNIIELTNPPAFADGSYHIEIGTIADRLGNVMSAAAFDVTIDLSQADSFTFVLMPDTQGYSESALQPFHDQTQWVVDHVATNNIVSLAQVGDLVQNGDQVEAEWIFADDAMSTLDRQLPYLTAIGNHDFDTPSTHSTIFKYREYFTGRYVEPYYVYESYDQLNSHQFFTAGGRLFHHIALEWEPRESSLQDARDWISANPSVPVILTTHSYLTASGSRSTEKRTADGHSGVEIFQELVTSNPQIFMVLSGHNSGEANNISYNDAGSEVIEIMADYQSRTNGGNGWMQLLEFFPDLNRIDVETYSPTLDQYETDANSQFSIILDFDQRFNFTFAPSAEMVTPLDNGPADMDPVFDSIDVATPQAVFEIQLSDFMDDLDDATVIPTVLQMSRNSVPLVEGAGGDYTFTYDANSDLITLIPAAGIFGNGEYVIDISTPQTDKIRDLLGSDMAAETFTVTIDTTLPQIITSVPQGSVWSYLDDGSDQGAAWRDPAFDDTGWASGPAQLGYGDSDEATVISYGPDSGNKYITSYFRHSFDVSDASFYTALNLSVLRDDGAVVYLNGQEIFRSNMPSGPVSYTTQALAAVGGGDESAFYDASIDPILLVEGTNALAVEIHQVHGQSSDLGFDLELTGTFVMGDIPPMATDDAYGANEDAAIVIDAGSGLLANDNDADGDPLSITGIDTITTIGAVIWSPDGSFTYDPIGLFESLGPGDSAIDAFTYNVSDGRGGVDTAAVTITVTGVNDPPVAGDDADLTDEQTVAVLSVLSNDADVDGGTLAVAGLDTSGTVGAVIDNGDGTLTYDPNGQFESLGVGQSSIDTFAYTVSDGQGDSDTATVTITITGVNDQPTASADTDTTDEDTAVVIGVLTNDTDPDGDPLGVASVDTTGTLGLVTNNGGSITYDPNGQFDWLGAGDTAIDTFSYTVSDGEGGTDPATVTVTVNGTNDAPVVATNTGATVAQGGIETIDNTELQVTDVDGIAVVYTLTAAPVHGTLELSSLPLSVNDTFTQADIDGGLLRYAHDDSGTAPDSFQFSVSDGAGGFIDDITFALTVAWVNSPPTVANPITDLTVNEDQTDSVVNLAAVFDDIDILSHGDSLSFSVTGNTNPSLITTWLPGANLTLSYAPDTNGAADITVRATDLAGAWTEDTFTVTVNPVNDAPTVANAISDVTVDEDAIDTVLDLSSVFGDIDSPAPTLSVEGNTNSGLVGTSLVGTNLTLSYTPDASGTAEIIVRATDTDGALVEDTFTVTVNAVNDAPTVANPIADVAVDEDASDTILDLSAVFGDIDSPAPMLLVQGNTNAGLVGTSLVGSQLTLSYSFDANGLADITVRATDAGGAWAEDTFTVTVNPINDAPTVTNPISDVTVDEDAIDTVLDLSSVFGDIDSPAPTLTVEGNTNSGLVSTSLIGTDLTLSYAADANGTADITIRATDADELWVADTFTVTVNPVNDVPIVANPVADIMVDEDAADMVINLAGVFDDVDILSDADSLSLSITSNSNTALVSTSLTGTDLTLSQAANANGAADITVRATDQTGAWAEDTFTLTADPINDIPTVAVPIADLTVDEDATDTVLDLAGVFDDVDILSDADSLSLSVTDNSDTGLVSTSLSGTDLTLSQAANVNGAADITIRATDQAGAWAEDTFTLTVNAINDTPVAADDAYSADAGATLSVDIATGVLANDSDLENDPLTAVLVADVSHGTLGLTDDGAFTYTPEAGFYGSDAFTYIANDGDLDSNPATVTIAVAGTGVVGSNLLIAGKKLNIDLNNTGATAVTMERLQLDWPAGNRKLTKVRVNDVVVFSTRTAPPSVLIDQWKSGSLANRTIAAGQTATLTLEFEKTAGTNENDYNLSIDFGDGLEVFIPMAQTNPPIAVDDSYAIGEDSFLSTNAVNGVLANDTDPDSDPLTTLLVGDVANGSLVLSSDGSFDYTPDQDFFGTDSFTYKANDGIADSGIATVTITVDPVNDPPVANDDSGITSQDTSVLIDVLANDTDVDGDLLAVTGTTVPANGSVFDNGDGTVTYTPAPSFTGGDSFSYTVEDGNGGTDTAVVAITVTESNDPPIAADDAYSVDEDNTLTVDAPAGVLANDSDPESIPLTAILVDDVANGTLSLAADGSFQYDPDPDFFGTDSFTYKANDGTLDSGIATVTITVDSVNDVPVATDDTYEVQKDGSLDVDVTSGVLANDSDPESSSLTAILVDDVANGALSLAADGSFQYTPNPGYTGTDSFTYVANDAAANSNVATVTITVTEAGAEVIASNLQFQRKKLLIDLTNTGDIAVTLERLQLDWPAGNRKLRKIRVDNVIVYDTSRVPPSALIDQWNSGSLANRTIGPGQTVTLTLEFERNASVNENDYNLSIDFGYGLEVVI